MHKPNFVVLLCKSEYSLTQRQTQYRSSERRICYVKTNLVDYSRLTAHIMLGESNAISIPV